MWVTWTGLNTTFQSTPPARGATVWAPLSEDDTAISIHAPREGGDLLRPHTRPENCDFNPRPPRGGRLKMGGLSVIRRNFNPRPPRGGRPFRRSNANTSSGISIHAPREGGDMTELRISFTQQSFQSTPPARGATNGYVTIISVSYNFNPRPPRGGRQAFVQLYSEKENISIHAPREGGDGNF